MSIHPASFGQVIRHEREQHDWSQETLAEKANLNRSYLGELERGEVVASLNTLVKLATAFQLRLSTLLARCEDDIPA